MKNHFKLCVAVIAAVLFVLAFAAPADAALQPNPDQYRLLGPWNATGTNTVVPRLTTNTASGIVIDCRRVANLWLEVKGTTTNVTAGGSATLTFSQSLDGTDYEQTSRHTIVLPLNGTSESVILTNLTVVPGYLKCTTLNNVSTNSEWTGFSVRWFTREEK